MKIPDAVIQRLVTDHPVARLATRQGQGAPHQVPIVYVWLDGCFWSPIDGKPKGDGVPQRVTNALSDPRGSLLIDEYDDDWNRLWWIRAKVDMAVVRLDESSDSVQQAAQKVITALEEKYPQYGVVPVLRAPPTLLSMRALRLHSWSATAFWEVADFD